MKYNKPSRTVEEQAELIISRGLLVDDKSELINILKSVNYYRLSAYWHPFKQPDESLQPGIHLHQIWRRYTFDRQLRLLVIDGIERVEIAIRTLMTNMFSLKYGPFGYLDISNFSSDYTPKKHQRLIKETKENTDRSSEEFVKHYKNKYGDDYLPLWMVSKVMTFGNMLNMFSGLEKYLQRQLATEFKIPFKVLQSWLQTLNYIRNLCAHHARLWNRELAIKPFIPRINKFPEWHSPADVCENKIFAVLTLIKYLLSFVAPQSSWQSRLGGLLNEYTEIPLVSMGFPENWKESPIWYKKEVQ